MFNSNYLPQIQLYSIQMSEFSQFSESNSNLNKAPKTKQQYSRNVKKLKLKLAQVQQEIDSVQKKIKTFQDTSNDKMIALKISKFCKQRRITPEMLFRFADRKRTKNVKKAVFKQTLISLGIKLTQHQLSRLQYLLDEDISGEISENEYNSYLVAFAIKAQYTQSQQFLKNILKKVDLLDLLKDEDKQKDPTKRKGQLLNYEQFIKFCHRKLPNLKDKQIAAIFNILQKNGQIDLDQFLDYIKKREEQRRRIEQKNKKKGNIDIQITDQSKTLKGIIKLLLKNRQKDMKPVFHSIQFRKLESKLGKDKGELLKLFKFIDKQKKGSFTFKQLIQFYIEKQKEKDILYTYELMGRKMFIDKEMPQDVLHRYNGGPTYKKISLQDFKKFMFKQFGVVEADAQILFRAIQKKENLVPIRLIIDAMKLQQGQKKMVYIKPTSWKTFGKDYWKKNCYTILFNPFVALRFCLHIADQLKKAEQTYWDDYQFGPTSQDPYGLQSINLENITQEQVKWLTVQSVGMNQFYSETNSAQYDTSSTCPDDTFPKMLCQLNKQSKQFLWNKQKIDYHIKKVEQSHLKQLFQGMYPLIFHSFASVGIYVFRFFVHEKWAYVIVDNKIPCNNNNEPIFAFEKNKKYSWISLIQKAFAKIKGCYKNIYNTNSYEQHIYEMNRKLPLILKFNNLQNPELKDKVWTQMNNYKNESKQIYSLVSNAAIHQLIQNKQETGLRKNCFYPLINLCQIKDQSATNQHKSHRLILLKNTVGTLKNEAKWNPNWNSGQATNKYDKFLSQIESNLNNNKVNSSVLKEKQTFILNYKLFRGIFDELLKIQEVSFEDMIILRKVAEFQEKFVCKYELNSKRANKQPVKLIVALNRVMSPNDTCIQMTLKDQKMIQISKKSTVKNFGAFEFQIGGQVQYLELKVTNWHDGQDHTYNLTFYFSNPQFHLKQLDRQLLFRTVSPYQQQFYLDIDQADEKQRKHIYRNFFKGAERAPGCCG